MCKHKILTENNNGNVLLCLDCFQLQVGFGTSLVRFSEEDFFDFNMQARNIFKKYQHIENVTEKRFCLSVYSTTTKMVLSLNELKMLTEMLNIATNMLVVYNLLYKNKIK